MSPKMKIKKRKSHFLTPVLLLQLLISALVFAAGGTGGLFHLTVTDTTTGSLPIYATTNIVGSTNYITNYLAVSPSMTNDLNFQITPDDSLTDVEWKFGDAAMTNTATGNSVAVKLKTPLITSATAVTISCKRTSNGVVCKTADHPVVMLSPFGISVATKPGAVSDSDFVASADTLTTGGFVPVNANNDNGSPDEMVDGVDTLIPTKRDKDVTVPIPNENDLLKLKLTASGHYATVRVSIETVSHGRAQIKLWKELNKTTLFLDGTSTDHVDVAMEDLPKELWIEGITEGAALREITLHLDPLDQQGNVIPAAKAALTVTPVLTDMQTSTAGGGRLETAGTVVTLSSGASTVFGSAAADTFTTSAESKNMPPGGSLQLIQMVQIVNAPGATLTTSGNAQTTKKYDFAASNAGKTLIDTIDQGTANPNFPFYKRNDSSSSGTTAAYSSDDTPKIRLGTIGANGPTPAFPLPGKGGSTAIDLTYWFSTYACWWYGTTGANNVLYPLGQATWEIHFQGTITPQLDADNNITGYQFQAGTSNLTKGTTTSGWPQFMRTNIISTPITQPVANEAGAQWQ